MNTKTSISSISKLNPGWIMLGLFSNARWIQHLKNNQCYLSYYRLIKKKKNYDLSSCTISETELDPVGLLDTETFQTVVSQVREGMQRQVRSRQDTEV